MKSNWVVKVYLRRRHSVYLVGHFEGTQPKHEDDIYNCRYSTFKIYKSLGGF